MSPEPSPAIVDLTNCDREPIHVPGTIQPHGALLSLRGPDLTIAQASANVAEHLGRSLHDVLGRPLSAVLDAEAASQVQAAFEADDLEERNPLHLTIAGRRHDGIAHRHAGASILEIEPVLPASDGGGAHPLRRALLRVEAARCLPELCQTVVHDVRRLTGFDRVMLYRFDDDGHGSVDAEALEPGLDPYLGLHYPASDIPRQARDLYLKSWLRIIPDARYTPVPLVPPARPDGGAPLDLSFAVLRSVSPIHLEYLANMGVRASMSVSLIVRGQLWGLVCAHHRGPRRLPYEARSACEVLGRLVSLQIAALADREAAALREARRGTQETLASTMRGGEDVLQALLSRPAELMSLVGAEGAAVVTGSEARTCGRAPPPDLLMRLSDWLDERGEPGVSSTASLASAFPPALDARAVASGLLTFALPGVERRRLLWFRPEIVQTVSWSGDPRKPVEADAALRLHPRRSFDLWKEEVHLRSRPWTDGDAESAEGLRRRAVEIDLERQVVREQQAVRARDDLVAVVSHDLRNPLGVIQMQTSQLLRVSTAAQSDQSRRLRTAAERIQRSVDRMNALIQDLLDLAKIEAGRFALQPEPIEVGGLVEETLALMRPLAEARRIAILAPSSHAPPVLADPERVFQVFSNLIGNAIKFTPEGGTIAVTVDPQPGCVLFTVRDTGPGIPADQLPQLFNRYWQAPRKGQEGTGLGLYIAKGIVDSHGGRIWVESTPGAGTRFMFTLPLA